MAVSVAQVRSNVAAKIAALSGFRQINIPPDYFGRIENTIAHLGFCVQVDRSNAIPERQRRSVGLFLNTVVRVHFAYRLRPHDAYPTDYDLALDKEEDVITAVMGVYNTGINISFDTALRRCPDSLEFMIIELQFSALHTITI